VKGDNEMKRARMIQTVLALIAMTGLVFWGGSVLASQKVLTGDVWVTMNQDQKVAYIWGASDVVDAEQELWEMYPELKVENLSGKAVEASKAGGNDTINDGIAKIDAWYDANPDKLDTAVLQVIWDVMLKPHLSTGIAGRPLE
jgi:hypothetical protein